MIENQTKPDGNDCINCGYKYQSPLENDICEECHSTHMDEDRYADEEYQVA